VVDAVPALTTAAFHVGELNRFGPTSRLYYASKRTADGLNRREILRCLKRYIARETYHTLRADLEALNST
jgi:transposase